MICLYMIVFGLRKCYSSGFLLFSFLFILVEELEEEIYNYIYMNVFLYVNKCIFL